MERTLRSGIGKKMWIGGFSDTDSSTSPYIFLRIRVFFNERLF